MRERVRVDLGRAGVLQQKGLLHEPQRCPDCRQKAKAERAAQRAQNMHDIVCSSCAQAGQVPFAPRSDRPVYCSTCFEARRGTTQDQVST
jgi:CxxC-x17-CxxC domain-containing protein